MKNRIIVCILSLALLLSLCGCRLAQPDEGGEGVRRDRLIGCYVTTEHLNLFDMEAYLNDNIGRLSGGGNITLDGDTSQYQGRIYAELVTETLTNENGESYEYSEYRFTELEGISLFAPTVNKDGESYITSVTDTPVNDVHFGSKSIDNGTGVETQGVDLEGTVYIPADGRAAKFYMNPVYQSDDGSVYLTAGSGLQYDTTLGGASTLSLSDEQTRTVNGEESISYTAAVKMNFDAVAVPTLVRVIEMDAENSVLKTVDIIPGELPETYEPLGGTAYLLLETYTADEEGNEVIARSIAEKDGEEKNITVFVPVDEGYLVKALCEVLWG